MKLTFLGTGTSQGVPVIGCDCEVCTSQDPRDKRTRTSALLQGENTTICFDTGPDFRRQMLDAGVRQLDAVVYTHQHKDHTAGLDDVRPFYFMQKAPFSIYANQGTLDQLKQDYGYIFSGKKYPGVPELDLNVIGDDEFSVGDLELLPIPVVHFKLPVLGFRANDLAYVTDTNEIPAESMDRLRGLDVLVLNALRQEKHYSHFNLEEALQIIEELNPRRAFLTHLSHLMGTHEEVSKGLPENVVIATDGMTIESD